MSLAGKTVLITGANGGIGLAAVQLALEEGAAGVFLTDLDLARARAALFATTEAEKELKKRVSFAEADITSESAVKELLEKVLATFGKLDAAVLNAGLSLPGSWLETSVDHVDKQHAVNTRGPWLCAKYAVKAFLASPHKGKGASLVFISSVASTYGHPGMSGYTASKWAVRGLSLTAAQEFGPLGVRSNCVQPGATDTPMIRSWMATLTAEEAEALGKQNTAGRMADPREVAQMIVFLASDKASFVNGATIAVHAGQTPT